jgi:hypothetical protein
MEREPMKNLTVNCAGYWQDEPKHTYNVRIALGTWDGIEDAEDEAIFYYMDGNPLAIGAVISDGFVITEIKG